MRTVILDTETTGRRPGVDEIVQLAIIDGEGGVLFDSYIRPEKTHRWVEAQRIHGIAPETVRSAPTLREVADRIQTIIDSADVIVGYSVNFDYSMLACAGIRFDGFYKDEPTLRLVDVMELFAPVYGEWDEYHGNWKWQKLSTAAAYYGYEWGDECAHDALADCRATLYVWKKLKEALQDENG